ncbi:FtsX-like permease family protein [Imperialibacter roseus]|uniref:FtsX-like permease family protein n=1 Tax=Imperialibacter roseus TaxID=1324217 RepID=A0ABZ0IJL5_9BACT|nr:FtsX-like permease family protein [Imperialibacter roseus]WOK04722.1 FtsX-like permease family protein [Imperialibacter roseus]
MKLKDAQIELIEKDLRRKGITYDPLHEDLVDHVCSEIEERMEKGESFRNAYDQVMDRFEQRGLPELNKETLSILSHFTMLSNFLTSSLRLFKRNMLYSAIRVVGLSLGVAALLLSLFYYNYEQSFDSFHPHADHIYRIVRTTEAGKVATTTFPLAETLQNEYPDYLFTHFFKDRSKTLFRKDNKSFYEEKMIWADGNFLQIFPFEDFQGNPVNALQEPYSVVLTSVAAEKYFNQPVSPGDLLEFKWNGDFSTLKVTGVIDRWPDNMHINFDFLVSFSTAEALFPPSITDSWNMNYCYTYAKLTPAASKEQFEESFPAFVTKYVKDTEKPSEAYLGFLQPVQSIHTDPSVITNYTNVIDPIYPQLAVAVGLLILIITSINFVTLTVAQLHERAKEVGIRRAIGASRGQVISQFVFETFLLVTVSFVLALLILPASIDGFNYLMVSNVTLDLSQHLWLLLALPGLIIVTTIVTGLYPAILFSRSNIAESIQLKRRKAGVFLRKALLTLQYVFASALIIFCIVIFEQIDYLQNQSIGYSKDQVVYIPHGRQIRDNPDVFKNSVMANPAIENVSLSFYKPTDGIGNTIGVTYNGQEEVKIAANAVDEDFFTTYKIDFLQGHGFEKAAGGDTRSFILNESAVKLLGIDNPLEATLDTEFNTGDPGEPVEKRKGKVIGVIPDVHFESLHSTIKPMIFLVKPYWYFYINVKLDGNRIPEGLAHLEATWSNMFPEFPFEYAFLDDEFARLYQTEKRLAGGLGSMALLALITTCLGLFGYIRFVTQQKTKEVGIRKVLGASYLHISNLFSKQFLTAILLASAIAWPVGYYVANEWLQNFGYHVSLTATPFVATLVLLLVISTGTVARELLRVMKLDPSKTLRYD